LKRLCCDRIVQHGKGITEEDKQKTEIASMVLKSCCKLMSGANIQIGRGLPLLRTLSSDDNTSDKSDDEGSNTGLEGVNEDDSGSENIEGDVDIDSEDDIDNDIKETMADLMYICCQRPEKRQKMLEKADPRLVQCICKCAENILKGEVPINYTEKDNLEKHKEVLRKLSDPKKSTKDKKDIIVQNGGNFLLSLIPTVVGALAAMFQ
jgi:hypothetical protein